MTNGKHLHSVTRQRKAFRPTGSQLCPARYQSLLQLQTDGSTTTASCSQAARGYRIQDHRNQENPGSTKTRETGPINFIASFKSHVQDVCANDQERLTHLKSHLVPLLANSIGAALDIPSLYQTTLRGLQRDYGNPRAVAASCSSDLLKIQPFKDEDP